MEIKFKQIRKVKVIYFEFVEVGYQLLLFLLGKDLKVGKKMWRNFYRESKFGVFFDKRLWGIKLLVDQLEGVSIGRNFYYLFFLDVFICKQ